MKLSIDQIKALTQGAETIVEADGGIRFFRFTHEELQVCRGQNELCTAGIQMEFQTDAEKLVMAGNTRDAYPIRSFFSFDIFVNEAYVGSIKNFDEQESNEVYADKTFPVGNFEASFDLGKGDKCVRIVFPHSIVPEISLIELDSAGYVEPIRKKKIMVAYGDSITQGYDALHPSQTYAMRVARKLDAELINKGIGGAPFLPELAEVPTERMPDYVTVAYGTNDWSLFEQDEFEQVCRRFMQAIAQHYAHSRIVVITPIWRADFEQSKKFGEFYHVERIIKKVCAELDDVTVVSGWDTVPHESSCFGDGKLHPNGQGFEHYARHLMKVME